MAKTSGREVYIVDGSRTPFLKARGKPGPFSATDLAVQTARTLLAKQTFLASELDEVITGCVIQAVNEANISRLIAQRIGCGDQVPAWTVQRNCGSGMQALDCAFQRIADGHANLILAGGTEALSHSPVLFNESMVNWLATTSQAKTLGAKAKTLAKLRLKHFAPVIGLLKGLTDPLVNLSMGQTAENQAFEFHITRAQMDEFAVASHKKLATAQQQGYYPEITPLYANNGKVYEKDDGVRADSSVEKLAKLKPYFDRKFGLITAANSSQITDGAAFVILASEEAVNKHKLPTLGKIVDCEWAGLSAEVMGYGPIHAATPLMQRHNFSLNDIDFWEINEAFAAQVLACIAAWNDDTYCQQHLGLEKAFGLLDQKRLNIDGGAIALGHPLGASGARLVLHLLHVLKRHNAKRGMAALCIGGGQGGAMLIECNK